MFSAIIPFYGTETETLFTTVKNIHPSPLIDEIIIVDDGSPEGTGLLTLFIDLEKVHVLRHGHNRGASDARNTGAEKAKGEYLLFVDSDVIVDEMSLAKAGLLLKEKKLPALQGIYKLHSQHLNAVSEYKHYWQMINILSIPEGPTSIVGTSLFAVKKDLYQRLGGFKKLGTTRASVEDRIFGIQMAKAGLANFLYPSFNGEHRHHFTLKSFLRTQFLRAMDEMIYRKEIAENKSYHSNKKVFVLGLTALVIPSVLLDVFYLYRVSGKIRLSWLWISLLNSLVIGSGVVLGFLKSL